MQRLPWQLKLVAYLNIGLGVLYALSELLIENKLAVGVFAVSVFLGVGLLLRWRLSRWCTIVELWYFLVTVVFVLVLSLWLIISPSGMVVAVGERHIDVSDSTARLISMAMLLFAVGFGIGCWWALRVLRRPEIRGLFTKTSNKSVQPTASRSAAGGG